MAFKTNAKTDNDKADFAAYKERTKKQLRGKAVEVYFEDRHVGLIIDDAALRMTRKRWNEWVMSDFPYAEGELPMPPAKAREAKAQVAPKEKPVKAAVATVKPQDKLGAAVEPDDNYLLDMAHRNLELSMQERQGEHGRNAARFRRGELMSSMYAVAKAVKRKAKDVLSELNERTLELAEQNAIIDFQPITEQEASTTRKVVEAFGSSGDFRLVDAVNRVTGEPLVADDGEPLRLSLTDVALNKLAPLTGLADEDQDAVLSFAYRNTEQVVKKAKSVANATGKPLMRVIQDLNSARVPAKHPVTGEVIQVQPEGRDALNVLREMAGEEPAPDVVSIKTSRGWYEAFFEPLRALYSKVMEQVDPSLLGSDGTVSNVFVLEQTITQFFNVHEADGFETALAALVRSETLSRSQAAKFLGALSYHAESGEWEFTEEVDFLDGEETLPDEQGREWPVDDANYQAAQAQAQAEGDLDDDDLDWDDDDLEDEDEWE